MSDAFDPADTALPRVATAEIVRAVNQVLSKVRAGASPVEAETPLSELELESIDYVEVFILLEEWTGAVFDLSVAPAGVETVGDLASYRRVT
jgi:acyl carrier protein